MTKSSTGVSFKPVRKRCEKEKLFHIVTLMLWHKKPLNTSSCCCTSCIHLLDKHWGHYFLLIWVRMALADKQGFHKIISGKGQKMAIILPILYLHLWSFNGWVVFIIPWVKSKWYTWIPYTVALHSPQEADYLIDVVWLAVMVTATEPTPTLLWSSGGKWYIC